MSNIYQKIKYISSLGEIDFKNSEPIILQSITGLSETKAEHTTTKYINQDGEKYEKSNLNKKEIVIKFLLIGNSHEDYINYRNKILRVINPKAGEGELIYSYGDIQRSIKLVPDESPTMPIKSNTKFAECEVVLLAHDPYMKDVMEYGEEICTWVGGMSFKFSLPLSFKKRGETKQNIYNNGHVETPIKIYFKGPANNPCVINHSTGEFIKVNRELTSDDTLIINTEFSNKTVEIERNGVRTNAFNYIDLDSTFFKLRVGDNLIEYTTENNLTPQSVEIRYRNRYIGI
ncbi:phage tail family protein [Romboutsia faecis]|uniref:phage tail family protein n=1 Tax=Romboutsia faecis TaxID=2764597 RepID=UPI00295F58DC|nr:phage tail family protein [Romboutsia faecis]